MEMFFILLLLFVNQFSNPPFSSMAGQEYPKFKRSKPHADSQPSKDWLLPPGWQRGKGKKITQM